MAKRKAASIETMAETQRPDFIMQYALAVQKLLQQQFPASAGYEHGLDWRVAACVNPKRHSLDVQKACRAITLKTTRGRNWGIVVTATPADVALKKLKVIVAGAVPFVEGIHPWIIKVASILSIVVGVLVFGLSLWQNPELGPTRSMKVGFLFGVAVFLSLVFIGLILLSPLRVIFSSHRMRGPIASGLHLSEQAWTEMQSVFPGLPLLRPRRGPTFFYACWLLVSLSVGAVCALLPTWSSLSTGVAIALGLVVAVAGVAALYTLLGVIVYLFGVFKE